MMEGGTGHGCKKIDVASEKQSYVPRFVRNTLRSVHNQFCVPHYRRLKVIIRSQGH